MSKSASVGMQAHIAQETSTLALMWKIIRQDGQEYFYTAHDQRITYDGDQYIPTRGFASSAVENVAGLAVNKTEVKALLQMSGEGGMTAEDLRSGLFDYAEIRIFVVNWANIAHGIIRQRRGWIGEATMTPEGQFQSELRSMAQAYSSRIVEVASPECRVDVFSMRCGLNADDFRISGEVTDVTSRRDFDFSGGVEAPPYYSGGLLTWTSGDNTGRSLEVFSHDGDGLHLFLPPAYPIGVGDTFDLLPGCDKLRATCRDKFANVRRFQGEPDLPGNDQYFLYPDRPIEGPT